MIDFQPTEEQLLMIRAVSQFAAGLRPNIREFERACEVPPTVLAEAAAMGLGPAIHIAASHGGAGLGLVTAVLLEEAMAEVDAGVAFGLPGGSFATAVAELCTGEQAAAWLPKVLDAGGMGAVCFSEGKPSRDRAGFLTEATPVDGGFVLHGEKAFVLNADRASHLLVFAQVDASKGWDGLGAFIVDAKAEGVRVGAAVPTLGLNSVRSCTVQLDGVKVTADARVGGSGQELTRATLRFFAKEGLKNAARSVGLCQSALTTSLEYVSNRKAFGKPIGHFQAIAFTLADRSMDVDAARTLTWQAAARWDQHEAKPTSRSEKEALLASAFAISFALEAAMKAGDCAVQLHGGAGFIRDYIVEKLMRDAKQLQVCFLTAEQADQIAATLELGLPLDPAVVLPTPETQSVFT